MDLRRHFILRRAQDDPEFIEWIKKRSYLVQSVNALTPTPNQLMFYCYILRSKVDSNLYIGSTRDLERRFIEHNRGKVSSTKSRKPFEIIYYEAYKLESDARKREHNLKLRSNALTQLKLRIKDSLS